MQAFLLLVLAAGLVDARSFVPATPLVDARTTNYWTTWYVQNYPGMVPMGSRAMGDLPLFAKSTNGTCPGCGWATHFFADARADMLLVLDDTWFAKPSTFANQWALDPTLFPDEAGAGAVGAANWSAGIAALVARVKAAGWAGLGLWHHGLAMCPASANGCVQPFTDLGRQLATLATAGVEHIKVDGTDLSGDVTAVAQAATGGALRIEHKRSPGAPLNGDWKTNGRAPAQYIAELTDLNSRTSVLRTDDIVCQLSVPTCLDRMAGVLGATVPGARPAVPGALGVIAPQDEAYMSAALGGSLAGMRYPLPQLAGDTRLNGNRNLTRRATEITRATRWGRVAPPTGSYCAPAGHRSARGSGGDTHTSPACYPSGRGTTLVDTVALTDARTLTKADTWFSKVWGQVVRQGAPARTARDLPHLPHVAAADARYPGVKPFVVASQHPNGVLAIGALGRTLDAYGGWVMPRANVTLYAGAVGSAAARMVGVFGQIEALTVVWSAGTLSAKDRVWMQDLSSDTAVDVTARVAICANGSALVVPGAVVDATTIPGPSTSYGSDLSDPGVLIVVEPSAAAVGTRSIELEPTVACPFIPAPDPPSPPPTPVPTPPTPPPPPPTPPIAPQELNGTWTQQSPHKPVIEVLVTNGGGDVDIVGHDAGRWDNGTGVVLNNVLDVHCVGPNGFATHQVGTASRTLTGLQIIWKDGTSTSTQLGAWAAWTKASTSKDPFL